jgi:hypothetical protein
MEASDSQGKIRETKTQDRITKKKYQFFMFAPECTCKRIVAGLDHYPLSDPLPELLLGGPEFFPVTTDDQCRFSLLPNLLSFLEHLDNKSRIGLAAYGLFSCLEYQETPLILTWFVMDALHKPF